MLAEMRVKTAGAAAPHNKLYRPEQDGVATTFAAFVAAALDVRDPYRASPKEVERIKRGHLLLAWANAMQPGVFSLSSWDLVGALPISEESVKEHAADGDYRWVNRGGVDLMGDAPEAKKSAYGLDRATVLYGPLPQQLEDPESFASQLKRMLAARKDHRIAEAELIAVPESKNRGVLLLVMKLPDSGGFAVTALNFGRQPVDEVLNLTQWPGIGADQFRGGKIKEVLGSNEVEVQPSGRLPLKLEALVGRTLVFRPLPK
jgi:trehalose synthase